MHAGARRGRVCMPDPQGEGAVGVAEGASNPHVLRTADRLLS